MVKKTVTTELEIKVYYEDTDCLGVVYYANYLKYFERGRTEYIEGLGRPIVEWNASGYNFAVFKMEITFHKPARLGDICRVVTDVQPKSSYRVIIHQRLLRGEDLLTEATVQLVCLDGKLGLREFPSEVLEH